MATVSKIIIEPNDDQIVGVSFDVEEGEYLLDDRTTEEIWLKVLRIDRFTQTAWCVIEKDD